MCNFKNLFVPLSVAPAPPVYAECRRTYVKLRKNAQMVNSVLLIYSLLMVLNPKYTDNLGL